MAIKSLAEKFEHGLGDIYDAEHQFLVAQQQMLEQASTPAVKRLLETHIKQTEQQIGVLEQAFKQLKTEAERIKCQAAAGIVAENKKSLKETSSSPILADLTIADGALKVEHYEISTYRSLISTAEALGETKIAKLLQKNLAQEEQTATKIEQNAPVLLRQAISAEFATTTSKGAAETSEKKAAKARSASA